MGTVGGMVAGGGGERDASEGFGVDGLRERDVREEARRELEEERVGGEQKGGGGSGSTGASGAFEEGLRMRRREYDMPGGMPGMMIN